MAKLNTHLDSLLQTGKQLPTEVSSTFGHLSSDQLNWKPSPKEWSVGQCIDHLIVTGKQYWPIFNDVIQLEKTHTWWEKHSFLSGFFGRSLIKSLQPTNKRKIKTSPVFEPSSSKIPDSIVQDFSESHDKLLFLMEQTDGLNTDKIIITSPISKVVTYSLQDAMTILIVHAERHIEQAKRVMERDGFPVE